jgi:hypothetical protein
MINSYFCIVDECAKGGIHMKKVVLVLLIFSTFLIWQSRSVFAYSDAGIGDASLYLEGRFSPQDDVQTTDNNWGSGIFGIDASVGPCKVTVEAFGKGTVGNDIFSNTTKVGFALINEDFIRLDATLSYHDLKITKSTDSMNTGECKGYLVGLDFQLALTEQSFIETAIGYSNAGSWKASTTDSDTSILLYKIKYDWMPWENFGFTAGYRNYSYRPSSTSETSYKEMYFGLVLRFNDIYLGPGNGAKVQTWGR